MFKMLATVSALAVATASPLVAGSLADPVIDPLPTAPVYVASTDWTGFYLGVHGGLGRGIVNPSIPGPSFDFTGLGAHAGYLYDMGSVVLGAEANYNYLMIDIGPGIDTSHVGVELIAGYDLGSVMPHVTVGAGMLDSGPLIPGGGWDLGYGVGAGVSLMATDNLMITARYNYFYYPEIGPAPGPALASHSGKVMASFRF